MTISSAPILYVDERGINPVCGKGMKNKQKKGRKKTGSEGWGCGE